MAIQFKIPASGPKMSIVSEAEYNSLSASEKANTNKLFLIRRTPPVVASGNRWSEPTNSMYSIADGWVCGVTNDDPDWYVFANVASHSLILEYVPKRIAESAFPIVASRTPGYPAADGWMESFTHTEHVLWNKHTKVEAQSAAPAGDIYISNFLGYLGVSKIAPGTLVIITEPNASLTFPACEYRVYAVNSSNLLVPLMHDYFHAARAAHDTDVRILYLPVNVATNMYANDDYWNNQLTKFHDFNYNDTSVFSSEISATNPDYIQESGEFNALGAIHLRGSSNGTASENPHSVWNYFNDSDAYGPLRIVGANQTLTDNYNYVEETAYYYVGFQYMPLSLGTITIVPPPKSITTIVRGGVSDIATCYYDDSDSWNRIIFTGIFKNSFKDSEFPMCTNGCYWHFKVIEHTAPLSADKVVYIDRNTLGQDGYKSGYVGRLDSISITPQS